MNEKELEIGRLKELLQALNKQLKVLGAKNIAIKAKKKKLKECLQEFSSFNRPTSTLLVQPKITKIEAS